MTDHPRFTTERRETGVGEMGWGTDSGQPWSDAIAESNEVTVGEAVGASPVSEIPDSETWQTPSVETDQSDYGDSNQSIDDDTSTYSVLESAENGYIEYSVGQEYKKIRFDFNDTIGMVDVTLQPSGTVLKENWDVSGNPWYVISLEQELGESNWKTDERYRIQVDDRTNKRIAETDADVET